MRIVKINPINPSLKTIKLAAEVIRNGGVIIYPTDTIYGIGANALDKKAIKKVYQVKERPEGKPLSIIIRDIKMAKKYCVIEKTQEEIFNALLPGPFTLIFKAMLVKKKSKLTRHYDSLENHSVVNVHKNIFTAYNNTLSMRIPDFKITELLARYSGVPFTATSANISGLPGSGDIKKVLKQLGIKKNRPNLSQEIGIDLVLDAGVLSKNNPSAIIDLTGLKPKIVRK